ncbi:MAG TPA: hypothetical protein VGQ65_06280 [Thermoanaerobaculia bacterium]|jgi:hypothetical protein|nr:hypothetical protein [Thermoanaerobaculia bacterium]
MPTWFLIAAFIALAVLGWNFYRRLSADRIEKFMERRRPTARMVSRADFIDGDRHVAVALAVTDSTFFYENTGMQATLDLQWVREIEYGTELATGVAVVGGKVLRLRCYSQTFEFVLPNEVVARWHMMMPPRRAVVPAVA